MASTLVATVVVNYRHYDDTFRCVASLQASKYLNQHLIVVDNTEPEAQKDLRDRLDQCVEVISADGNRGFAAGCNIGIRSALDSGAEFVWLVNPDAAVAPDTLTALMGAAEEHPDAGIIGSRILDGDNPRKILFNGGVVDASRKGATLHQDQGKLDADVPDIVREVDYITGACLLVRRDVIRQIGMLPEEYFLYYEETDFCLRARVAGWRNIIAPYARTWHFKRSTGSLPTPYYIYYMCRNRIHFSRRFFGAEFHEVMLDLTSFITSWRGRVETHAPHLISAFDKLTQLALDDGREGRLGQREDIADLFSNA